MVSLDFLDENRLLFTFHVPGLLHREPGESQQRQIRAEVLALPSGAIQAETVWTLHDRARYLWMLPGGHFLLRDRDTLTQVDANLQSKPLFQFPGPLLWVEMDPTGRYLVTDSEEPTPAATQSADASPSPARSNALNSPGRGGTSTDAQELNPPGQPDLVVRILLRDSGKVLLISRSRIAVHIPLNADGYLESLRGRGLEWLLNLNRFTGGAEIMGRVASTCPPTVNFISQRELLASVCDAAGGDSLVAVTTEGRRLWQYPSLPLDIWPLLVIGPDGSRLARETLAVDHEVNAYQPFGRDDVRGQRVRIVDAATGKVALETPADPVFDAGGNVAISPSGRRVAVLNNGAIQVFDLPPPSQLPDASQAPPKP
jgi:hypothetical protein